MAKKRAAPEATYQDLGQVDQALELIAATEADAARLAAERDERVAKTVAYFALGIQSLQATAKEARALVEEFADLHPELFESPRHQDLPHGKIGYREVSSIKLLASPDTIVAALESRRLYDAVIVKKSPNRDVHATFPDDLLAEVKARRVVKDAFYCECKAKKCLSA
jgi:phage host-nuclease inhibitor protein Gam